LTERKERRDAAENRRIILQKAQSLFAEHGANNVSMHQIAMSAGIGQGTLYRRYAHKGDLCLDIIQESFRRIQEELEICLQQYGESPVNERIEKVLSLWLDFIEEKVMLMGQMQVPICEDGRSFFYLSPIYQTLHKTMQHLYEEVARSKSLSTLDPVFTADAILASTNPGLYHFLRHERGYSTEKIKSSILALYVEPFFAK
jgi:AcrR family transcriptional regulator